MRKLIITLLMICVYSTVYAQQLTIKSVNRRPQDARARTNPRDDGNGKKCAIIRVGVVGVENLVFPDAVGNVDRSLSEYVVYVPEGLKTLRYNNKEGKNLGVIKFDDWDQEINSLASYDVIFESSDHLRSAIFSIQPANATLVFDGKRVEINKNGMAMINKPVGEYSYKVEAKGFLSQQGKVTLEEDDISTVTDVVLEEQLYPVSIKVVPDNATVFIDNVPYNKASLSDLKLSEGTHVVRVTAENYKDEERSIKVGPLMVPESFTLKAAKQEVVKHKEERTRTKVNIRNAFYLAGGIGAIVPEKDVNFTLGGLQFDFSFIHHFGGILAMREGIGVSLLTPTYSDDFEGKELLEDSLGHIAVDIPIQLGISIPFGKYNKHLFSIFAGGYGRGIYLSKGKDEAELYREKLSGDHFELKEECYDWGVRASFKLDISKFTIGADISKSLNGYGYFGSVTIGMKLYTLSKD
jgi:hypothetical protein